jgi:hypothetical protein
MVAFGMLSDLDQTLNLVQIFPNPANSVINITNLKANSTIQLFNIQGKLIVEKKFSEENPSLNIENLSNGLYTIKINGLKSLKFVKSN